MITQQLVSQAEILRPDSALIPANEAEKPRCAKLGLKEVALIISMSPIAQPRLQSMSCWTGYRVVVNH